MKNRNRIIQLSDFSVSGVWLPFARCTALMWHATVAATTREVKATTTTTRVAATALTLAIAIAKNHSSIHNKSMTVDWQLADSRDVRRMDTWHEANES